MMAAPILSTTASCTANDPVRYRQPDALGDVCDPKDHVRTGKLAQNRKDLKPQNEGRGETCRPVGRYAPTIRERDMDQDTKHEIVVLALSTLAAVPVVTGVGLAIVTGILAW